MCLVLCVRGGRGGGGGGGRGCILYAIDVSDIDCNTVLYHCVCLCIYLSICVCPVSVYLQLRRQYPPALLLTPTF